MGEILSERIRGGGEAMDFSVILPCYQAQATLTACLESILSQEGADFELLCVDDGSLDDTGTLLDQAAARDARVRVWHTENQGVSAARNMALSFASRQYALFVDADDLLLPGALHAFAQAPGSPDVLYGDYQIREGTTISAAYLPDYRDGKAALHTIVSGEGSLNAPWAKAYRLAFLRARSLAFPADIRIGEDALFNLRAFDAAESIWHVPAFTYLYILNPASAMQDAARSRYQSHRPMLEALDAYLRETRQKTLFFRDLLQLTAALMGAQYGDSAAGHFAEEADFLLCGVRASRLPARQRLLYTALRLGRGGWVYDRVKGDGSCASV